MAHYQELQTFVATFNQTLKQELAGAHQTLKQLQASAYKLTRDRLAALEKVAELDLELRDANVLIKAQEVLIQSANRIIARQTPVEPED